MVELKLTKKEIKELENISNNNILYVIKVIEEYTEEVIIYEYNNLEEAEEHFEIEDNVILYKYLYFDKECEFIDMKGDFNFHAAINF